MIKMFQNWLHTGASGQSHRAQVAISAGLIFLCAACSPSETLLTRNQPEPTLYLLHAPSLASYGSGGAQTVQILPPQMAEGLQTDRIALTQDDRQMQYFSGGRWTGELGDVLEEMLVESLTTIPGMVAVNDENFNVIQSVQVIPKISAFQAEYAGDLNAVPTLHLAARFFILDKQNETILATVHFDETLLAEANSLSAVAKGLEQLWHRASEKLASTLRPIRAAP